MKKSILSIIAITVIGVITTVFAISNDEIVVSASDTRWNYIDVTDTDWFFNDVKYVCDNGLMNGTSISTFEPNGATTRGMIVTVLWRLEGMPDTAGSVFSDVEDDQYYNKAVGWAAAKNIVVGYGDGRFGPLDNITREQIAAILYRYAVHKGYDVSAQVNLDSYCDENEISEYAVEYIKWANAEGLITGTSHETLSPQRNALRSEVAAILKRFCENVVSAENSNGSENAESIANYGEIGSSESVQSEENKESPHSYIGISFAIIADGVTAAPGDREVLVPVRIENNPGVLGMILSVSYDETVMSMTSVENGEAVSEVLTLTHGSSFSTGCIFVWDGLEISSSEIKNGTILLMKFSIADNAPEGNYQLVIVCDEGDVVDSELYAVSPLVQNGHITIRK